MPMNSAPSGPDYGREIGEKLVLASPRPTKKNPGSLHLKSEPEPGWDVCLRFQLALKKDGGRLRYYGGRRCTGWEEEPRGGGKEEELRGGEERQIRAKKGLVLQIFRMLLQIFGW